MHIEMERKGMVQYRKEMDEKVRYPIERSPFYPAHSFTIFFLCFDLFHCRSTLVLLASFIHIYMVWRTIMPIERK